VKKKSVTANAGNVKYDMALWDMFSLSSVEGI
jgi:hypothetical protein